MNKPLQTSPLARTVERNLFGTLLGMLASTLVARLLLLAYGVPQIVLIVLLLVGAASGAFVTHYGSRSAETVVVSFRTWNTRLRRVSLKVMLWMLGLAAILGVLSLLTESYGAFGRIAGTVIATAIVAGIPWPLSVLADREDGQAAGLLGMTSVLAVYFYLTPLIWDLGGPGDELEIVICAVVIGLTAPFGMFFLSLKNVPATWISARVGVGVYVAVLVTFLVATWHPGPNDAWWQTGLWCAAYGSLSFASLCGMREFAVNVPSNSVSAGTLSLDLLAGDRLLGRRGDPSADQLHHRVPVTRDAAARAAAALGQGADQDLVQSRSLTAPSVRINWRWLGVAAAFLSWILILLSVWGQSAPAASLTVVISSLAVVIAHASLAAMVPLEPHQTWVRLGTVAMVAVAALLIDAEVIFNSGYGASMLGRLAGAAAIVAS